ncbi:MAG: hypothetical protein C4530_11440 [Desulfobacteraceae bacterium]|nr:MAG: hypothetical protein C4530_11440 [Desulfobacteraceae bacterium]
MLECVCVCPVEKVERLAHIGGLIAQREAAKSGAPAAAEKTGKTASGRSQKLSLGPLRLDEYFSHFGREFSKKQDGLKTKYFLGTCLFDENHRGKDSYILQDDAGKIIYHCSHNSCRGRTWHQAKEIISGTESLARFCRGYDPNFKSANKKSESPPDEQDADASPFVRYTRSGRPIIDIHLLAKHIESKFNPLLYEGKSYTDQFYRYDEKTGLWGYLPEDMMAKFAAQELAKDEKPNQIREAIQLVKHHAYKNPDEIHDAVDPMILNLQNGMLDIRTMELSPHAPHYMSRVRLPVSYNKDAVCPLWEKTLLQIFEDDTEKIDVLMQFIGYCLYPKILFPAALFQIGAGRNGKGTVEHVLVNMLGDANVSHISLARMQKDFGPIEIRNKLLNSCAETESKKLDVTNFKQLVAGDRIQAEVKYKGDVAFRPIAKHMISMNHYPGINERTGAFFRRIIVLKYNQEFKEERDDKRLRDKLVEEIDGIFLMALEHLQIVIEQEKIAVPQSVEDDKEMFREKANPALLYIKERCLLGEDFQVYPTDLYKDYWAWAGEAGINEKHRLGKIGFFEQLLNNFPAIRRKRVGTKEVFSGIGLQAMGNQTSLL